MRNHFHLALETPDPNLVDGMHRLQSTFGTRFNRFRSERGHLFQGRYQALLVEDDVALSRVIHYIHLNPVRAGEVPLEALKTSRWCSLARLVIASRPPWLVVDRLLGGLSLPDESTSWARDLEFLIELAADSREQQRLGFDSM